MDSKKWDRVLVDWVNCLKLCKPIQKLDDLKDGIFFTNLQKLLRKTTEIDTDVLTCLFRVLGQHYPDFIIDNKANIHLTDLSSSDLSAITSLLLHYTCIHDRRDVLTSPLCYNLQQITQICIKNFLEKIQVCTKITNEELINIIQCCVDEIEKKPDMSCHLLAIANTPVNRKSPLQDLLRTPASKNVRLQEKERELNKLKTELELVQDEKESLEEDLKLQIEKNTRLEKQLHQKATEISRLKSEVLVLESRTPPHYQDKDSRETQRILRTKIDSLEQILEQCDREIKELIDERDSEKSQVKTLEAQCKVWLEKFIESDNKLQCLSEESKEREFKFVNLVSHCRELETLLEELKGEHKNDSFIEESFQCLGNLDVMRKNMEPLPPSEDLAHSVIDIQLKDVQKENEQLKSTLYEAENDSKGLKENIGRLLQDIELLKSEKIDFEDALKKRNDECEEMSLKHEKLEEQFIKLFEQNATVLKQKEKLSEKLEEFVKEHETIAFELKEALQKIAVVCEQLETVQSVKEEVSNKLDSTVKELEVALFEKQDIFNKLQETTNENDKNRKSFETEKLKNKNIVEDLNKVSEKLKTTVEEKMKIISELEKEKFEKKQLAESLEEALRDLNNAISTKNEIIQMKSVILEQLDGFNTRLIKANEQICATTDRLQSLTLERNSLREELDKVFEEKQEVCENLHDLSKKLERVATEKHEILEKFQKKSEDLEEALSKINILNETFRKVNEEKSHLFEQLGDIQSDHSKTKHKLETISKNLHEVLLEKENLLENNKVLTSNLESVRSDKENLLQLSKAKEQELQVFVIKNNDLLKKLEAAALKNEKLTEKIEELLQEKTRTSTELQIITSEKQEILDKLANSIKDKNEMLNKVEEALYEKNHISEQLQNVLREKKELEKLIEKNKEISEELLQEKQVISKFLDLNTSQLRKVSQEKDDILDALEMSNKEVQKIVQEKNDVIEQMSQEKIHLLEQLTKRSEEKIELAESLQLSKKKLEAVLKEKDDFSKQISSITKNCKTLQTSLEEAQSKFEKIYHEKDNISEQYERICKEKAEFSVQLDKASQENVNIKEKLLKISQEKVQLVNSLEAVKNVLGKMSEGTDFKDVEKIIKEKLLAMQSLETRNKELLVELEDKSKTIKKLEEQLKEKTNICCLPEHKDILEAIKKLSREKNELAESLHLITKELEKLSQEKHNLAETFEKTCVELQKVKQSRNEILESQTKIMKETENNILLAHENAVEVKNDLIKRIELAEKEKQNLKKNLESDLQVIRQAYANVVSTNSKYELENVNLRKKIEDKNKQLTEFAQIKEAYEKLLEENNKLMTEVDTVKYKRARDREDFVNLLKKERMEADARESKKVREVRNDYEAKLEKMKEKMLKLYREEINKEMAKVKAEQNETTYYQKTINELKSNLFEAEQKIHLLETEREMLHIKESKREVERNGLSIVSHTADFKNTRAQDSNQLTRRAKSSTTIQVAGQKGERKMATLPRSNFTEVEETITISRRTSINGVPSSIGHNIEMEDEDDDLFNNKYLADLKDGRCTLPLTGRESNVSRFSELAWRNSLVPPHLKSSYPAETQFLSPTHFKEDDIKTGNVEGDDSMCRLLPGEKPRQRKDFGTTSYKKPGPPTPSKNGGRLSLQGNEIQPLREHNDKTPKKVTPSRIKALFMGRPSINSLRENSENQCATPRTKRLSIFRKQR